MPSEEAMFRAHGIRKIPSVSPNWQSPPKAPRPTAAAHPCQWPTGCPTIVDGDRPLCRFHEKTLREQEAQP